MELLLYGLGKMTEHIEKIIKKEHKIIGYMDSFALLNSYHGKKFYKVNEIEKIKFDYIIITVSDRKTAWEIRENLFCTYGIKREKIIPFSVYAKSEIVENIILDSNGVEGIILGNSHACFGYLPAYMDQKFINLACPNQDIYCCYKVFQRLVEKQDNLAVNLKYVIFDLWDYNFFNFDLSLSKVPFRYLINGGIVDKHNYDHNTHFSRSYEDEMFKENYMIAKMQQEEMQCMKMIFGTYVNPLVIESRNAVNNRWNYIKGDEPMPFDAFLSSIVSHRFEETILENVRIMEEFFQEVYSVSSKIKIIFTLMPMYITMEKTRSVFMKEWQIEFENIVGRLQKRYGVYFINYKNRIEISGNKYFYYDTTHLNTVGGRCMTSILNEDIKRITKK